MNSTTMTNDLAVGFDLPFVHMCDLGATWRGLGVAPAGHSGEPYAGLPQLFRSTSARTGLGLQGQARVPGSGGAVRERGERFIGIVEATPRYGAPGQCPRRNSGRT